MTRQLSQHERETLRQFENAALLRDLASFPGWVVFKELSASKIQSIRDNYESASMDKEATWAAKIALQAVRDFHRGMVEIVEHAADILHPEAMKSMIERAQNPDPTSFDGELGLANLRDDVL